MDKTTAVDHRRIIQSRSWAIHEWALLAPDTQCDPAAADARVSDALAVLNSLLATCSTDCRVRSLRLVSDLARDGSLPASAVAPGPVAPLSALPPVAAAAAAAGTSVSPPSDPPSPPLDAMARLVAAARLASSAGFDPVEARDSYSSAQQQQQQEEVHQRDQAPAKKKRVKRPRAGVIGICRMCGTTETTEWKRGPDGTKSLCADCGYHFAKILKSEQLHSVKVQGTTSISAIIDP